MHPNWQLEFHVHIDASLLAMHVLLAWNPTGKYDQPIVYAFCEITFCPSTPGFIR
jgi:hypothetical protein